MLVGSPGVRSPHWSPERVAITEGLLASDGNQAKAPSARHVPGDHLPKIPEYGVIAPGGRLTRLRFGQTRSER